MENIVKNQHAGFLYLGIVLVSVISLGFFMQSCSKEDNNSLNTTLNSQEANIIASEYLKLIDNQYVLNLSEREALALGISQFDYDRMQTEIREVNAFIIDNQENGINIELNDPNEQVEMQNVRLKGGGENSGISGYFIMTSVGGSWSGFVPSSKTKITLTLITTAVVGTCAGNISCGGYSIPYTISGGNGTSVTKNLPYNNTHVIVTGHLLPYTSSSRVNVSFQ